MEFCSKCGSYLQKTKYGFLCPRCGNKIRAETKTPQAQIAKTSQSTPIYVDEGRREDERVIDKTCPKCGNLKAFRQLTGALGEHAGVKSDRTIEQFTCTKCGHKWARSA